ncbi:MAG: NAD-dependent epimerase/dehydratase family protein [Chloroflexi bacterium]|nr:NAD-dependent epimerase/dehydratase family protein [Chloroflexota bacterium]
MKRFLITGGKGFIGQYLTKQLTRLYGAQNVIAVGREFDLTLQEQARALFSQFGSFDYIIHLADVQGDADWSSQHAATQFMANTAIAWNILNAWHTFQPQAKLIGMSSLWSYPEAISIARENEYWNGRMYQMTEHYGLSKKFLGVGIEAHKKQYGLKSTMLVLGSIYGPNDSSSHVIPSLIRRMIKSPQVLEIWGDGSQTRDFIYIEDQVEGILRHLDFDGELLNIGSGINTSLREVVEILVKIMQYRGRIVFNAEKSIGVVSRSMEVSVARSVTGWPDNFKLHSLDEGLQKAVDFFLKENA